MNYTQTLEFLFQSLPAFETKGATAYKPGLERITAFCRHIGNPQRNFFTIHVAGTNGKGSVSHIIASVLQQAGYRTGLFTSPHLQDFRERIRVDGEMIPKQKVVNFVDKHHDKMVELELSFFEMTAALAFDYFAQSDVEVAVIETGLGGRLDADEYHRTGRKRHHQHRAGAYGAAGRHAPEDRSRKSRDHQEEHPGRDRRGRPALQRRVRAGRCGQQIESHLCRKGILVPRVRL